ncbi:MAG: N-glycosylase/DNA lyase [Spirochaetes bacterium]|nr:MAG: N-glycosylase/DNA lyase [Spirochaetota bacterium]
MNVKPLESNVNELIRLYAEIRPEIRLRTALFASIWRDGTEEDIFAELVFCLLTPQSGAFRCARALEIVREDGLMMRGTAREIAAQLAIVRFRNKKASYIVEARDRFMNTGAIDVRGRLAAAGDLFQRREWLATNIKGLGFKEASHFLRNVGWGEDLAILDRHILRNLVRLGVIDRIPPSISGRRYLAMENSMRAFALEIGIPLGDLDFVLWYREAGAVFK